MGLVVFSDTLRKPDLRFRNWSPRVGTAPANLLLLPILSNAYDQAFGWACFSPVISAEAAAGGVSARLRLLSVATLRLSLVSI